MDTFDLIKHRQIFWATRHGIQLVSSVDKKDRGVLAYTPELHLNLFEPLSESSKRSLEAGDGNELKSKMRAVHSSSALAINFFHYWDRLKRLSDVAKALKIPSGNIQAAEYECKRPVMSEVNRKLFPYDPNLDVVIRYSSGPTLEVAVESKFTEPFGRRHNGLKKAYLDHVELWKDIPKLRALAESVSPNDDRFASLDVPQLLKHLLGLLQSVRADGSKRSARLFYLFYDAPGASASNHRIEIETFAQRELREQFPDGSPVSFESMSYQEALINLALKHRDTDTAYVDWMLERYL